MHYLWHASFPLWQFVLRGAVVYLSVLLLVRMGGKRQIGQMGSGEFVAILLISNAVQNAMNGGDNSVTGGLVLAVVIIVLSVAIAYLTYRYKSWEHFIEGRPRLLVHDGKLIHENLAKEKLNVQELMGILRRQGVHSLSDIRDAILETNGAVSLTKKGEEPFHQVQPEK
jgi:uncharacterized membrane protein YcaP (DUF421 family)